MAQNRKNYLRVAQVGLAADGRPLLDRAVELLPAPGEEKVVALPGRG
jgi:hypothetical protein